MGDVLWIEPIIEVLSKKYKKLIVYTKFTSLFDNYPADNVVFKNELNLIDKILISIDTFFSTSLFSINLDMSYEKDAQKHILFAYFKKAGLPEKRVYPKLFLSGNEKDAFFVKKPYLVLHLSASSTTKNFRNVFGIDWNSVIQYAADAGFEIIELGDSPGKFPQFYKKTTIREVISILAGSAIFIGLDSGPSHIAAALNIPSILFFGAVNPEFRHFTDQFKGIILQNNCEYAGCYHTNPTAYENHTCRLVGDEGIPKCCNFTTNQVLNAIDQIIKKYPIKNA